MTAETLLQEQVIFVIIKALDGFSGNFVSGQDVLTFNSLFKLHKTLKSTFPTMQTDSASSLDPNGYVSQTQHHLFVKRVFCYKCLNLESLVASLNSDLTKGHRIY